MSDAHEDKVNITEQYREFSDKINRFKQSEDWCKCEELQMFFYNIRPTSNEDQKKIQVWFQDDRSGRVALHSKLP